MGLTQSILQDIFAVPVLGGMGCFLNGGEKDAFTR